MCQARKKIKFDQFSFLNINADNGMYNKYKQILFIFLFVIPKVCLTVCIFHFLNLESLKRIYTSLFTFRDFRHHHTMILKVEDIKTCKNCRKELYSV